MAQATSRVELLTYVTCPTVRYHPAVVAQQAATIGLLSEGRFTLGLGAGENPNEHIVARGWPPANVRHEMLAEAIDIITQLFGGDYVNYAGRHFRIDSAKLWDVEATPPKIGVAVSGRPSCELAGRTADAMIAVEPDPNLGAMFDEAGGAGKPRIGQIPISWDPSKDTATDRAHDQFRWFGGGWKVNAELPGTAGFAAASQFVRKDDIADAISCGPDIDAHVKAIRQFADAGFTDIAVIQIGGDTRPAFLDWAEHELLPACASRPDGHRGAVRRRRHPSCTNGGLVDHGVDLLPMDPVVRCWAPTRVLVLASCMDLCSPPVGFRACVSPSG